MATKTFYLGLTKPTPGINGDTWAQAAAGINDSFDQIDEHDHSSGKGVPVPSDGININKNLSFNNHSLESLKQLGFTETVDAASVPNNSIYTVNNDLYYKNANGVEILNTTNANIPTIAQFRVEISPEDSTSFRIAVLLTDNSTLVSNYVSIPVEVDSARIPVNTDKFTNNLSSDDDTLQKALDTLDKLVASGGGGSGFAVGAAFPANPSHNQTFGLNQNIDGYPLGIYYYDSDESDWFSLAGGGAVVTDATLTGEGTEASPLGVVNVDDVPTGEETPIVYTPSVIYHDPNKVQGNHLVPLSEVIAQIEDGNTLYTQRQTGSFVSTANFNALTVETVTYGNLSAKALVVTYNGNLFEDQQLIKFELIDSTGNLSKEYLFPPSTIRNGFDYVASDALANASIHKKEARFRITYDSTTNKTKIFIHQRPVSDPPPALYLFIVALYNVKTLTIRGGRGDDGKGALAVGTAFPDPAIDKEAFALEADITNYKKGIYYYDLASTTWKPLFASIGQQFHGRLNVNTIYQSNEIF